MPNKPSEKRRGQVRRKFRRKIADAAPPDNKSELLLWLSLTIDRVGPVIFYGRELARVRQQISPSGAAPDSVWDQVDAHENELLRAVEKLADVRDKALGVKDSG